MANYSGYNYYPSHNQKTVAWKFREAHFVLGYITDVVQAGVELVEFVDYKSFVVVLKERAIVKNYQTVGNFVNGN